MKLSVVILTKNYGETIQKTLDSVEFADEVVIVEDPLFSHLRGGNSAESPPQRCKIPIEIFQRRLNNNFAEQRNFGMEKARGEWILFVDCDEVVTKELTEEIRRVIQKNNLNMFVYYIKRRDFWKGRELKFGEVETARSQGFIRLVKKGSGLWKGAVHERFVTQKNTGVFKNFINHYPHQTIKEFLKEINFYSSLRAKELIAAGKRVSVFEIILYPFFKFVYTYFFKLGFLDAEAGFIYAFFMSFHSFLVRAKLYQSKIIK